MPTALRIKFDPNQDYQLEAISSVLNLFNGLPKHVPEFSLNEEIAANLPEHECLSEGWLYDNLLQVQAQNSIPRDMEGLVVDEGLVLEGAGTETWRYPSFTIEMETGTGKTYVYLRTIYELRKRYGFSKFIIVVPSVAIYEGVIKNFEITKDHFRAIYGNEVVNLSEYSGSHLSRLRSFASSSFAEVMVITLDSFNRISNNIYKPSEKLPGERRPYHFIQETRPILILDEPQNMESDKAKEALRTLHPSVALRYSATHKTSPNLIYKLSPFEAYSRNLVKKIQVFGVTERDNFNQPFLGLETIVKQPELKAVVRTYVQQGARVREADVVLKQGDDLFKKTKYESHKDGYKVEEIRLLNTGGAVRFQNGLTLSMKDVIGPSRPEIFRVQIEKTIEQHMEMQEMLLERGVKVLSLFFIDRVRNYTDERGIVKTLFDEAFCRIRDKYSHFKKSSPSEVREAYFATIRLKSGDDQAIDSEGKNAEEREAEKAAYELIMKNKEQLLSLTEPVSFIFAHSALKEGWDNPNVFQVCTLNQTVSEIKKRQEIGRGLRLCVDQQGNRVLGEGVNILTVVANESYSSYASNLQREYVESGDAAPPAPTSAGKQIARRNERLFKDAKDFQKFWSKLSRKTEYHVEIDTARLVEECLERLNNCRYPEPMIVVEKGDFVVKEYELTFVSAASGKVTLALAITDTLGNSRNENYKFNNGSDLSKIFKDPNLRGFRLVEVNDNPKSQSVKFENGTELKKGNSVQFQSEAGQVPQRRNVAVATRAYPIPNLIAHAASQTGLTRRTLNTIFRGINENKRRMIFKNPEGFSATFINEIQNTFSEHVAERIKYATTAETWSLKADDLFPQTRQFPQKELIESGDTGLYDKTQIDSGEERKFVEQRLKPDDRVVLYFKFPPRYKVPMPKMIGNYNPDWGVVRLGTGGNGRLELVRETKGTLDVDALRFPQEAKKLKCAKKHFKAVGIDYRHITSEVVAWWQSEEETPSLLNPSNNDELPAN